MFLYCTHNHTYTSDKIPDSCRISLHILHKQVILMKMKWRGKHIQYRANCKFQAHKSVLFWSEACHINRYCRIRLEHVIDCSFLGSNQFNGSNICSDQDKLHSYFLDVLLWKELVIWWWKEANANGDEYFGFYQNVQLFEIV